MLTLLGCALGFFASTVPYILRVCHNGQDRRHELAILDRRIEHLRFGNRSCPEDLFPDSHQSETQTYSSGGQVSGWIDGLRASVRPLLLYLFFLLFTVVKFGALYVMVSLDGVPVIQALHQIWDPETQPLFAAVVSFWFGQRAMIRIYG